MSIFGFLISDIFYKIQKFLGSSWASIIMHKDLLHLYYLDVDNSFGFDNKVDERKKITFLCGKHIKKSIHQKVWPATQAFFQLLPRALACSRGFFGPSVKKRFCTLFLPILGNSSSTLNSFDKNTAHWRHNSLD